MEATFPEEREGHEAEAETIRKHLADLASKTVSGRSKKKRAELASEIKTEEAAFEDATKASLDTTSSEEERD